MEYIKIAQTVLLAVLVLYTSIMAFDFIVYAIKSSPKSAMFTYRQWKLAFVTSAALIYYFLNNFNWI